MNEFARLLIAFPDARASSRQLVTPNREDDDDIKMAIVGFSYHRATEGWSRHHYELIRSRCDDELSNGALREQGNAAPIFRSFACFALGALPGLRASQQIDDAGFGLGAAQLFGFMYAHLPEIERLGMAC